MVKNKPENRIIGSLEKMNNLSSLRPTYRLVSWEVLAIQWIVKLTVIKLQSGMHITVLDHVH